MTRREDPNWDTREIALIADEDTFHVANACPQVQGFNAPIWLTLEDYVKGNAWAHGMKVSVMTGPVFAADDPEYTPPNHSAVKVPTDFWKIVVFRHDDTGDVACTAYMASQATQLPKKNRAKAQFVFGQFKEYQMKVADLEELTDLDFGELKSMDVIAGLSDGVLLQHSTLSDVIMAK